MEYWLWNVVYLRQLFLICWSTYTSFYFRICSDKNHCKYKHSRLWRHMLDVVHRGSIKSAWFKCLVYSVWHTCIWPVYNIYLLSSFLLANCLKHSHIHFSRWWHHIHWHIKPTEHGAKLDYSHLCRWMVLQSVSVVYLSIISSIKLTDPYEYWRSSDKSQCSLRWSTSFTDWSFNWWY